MSGCAHSNDCEMPVSPGELCPVDGAGTDHEDLEHMKITEFDCEEEAGSRAPVKVADPKLPSAEEVETHNLTHLTYRSWCPHCVRGTGKTMDHRRAGRPKMIPELHVDHCFMGSKREATARCIVVAKDYEHKCVMASVVPVKGSSHEFPAKRIGAFIRELGLEGQDIVVRSDQEPALQDLLTEVGKRRTPAITFREVSLVGSSASNGVAERGVQTVEGQVRVLKDALEMRLETEIPSNHNILAWLVEFTGTVVNRYEVGRDGKTPYERLRGKQSRLIGLEFGEKVNFRRTAVGARMAKLDSLWSDGVFLGYRSISGEVVVGTRDGVFKTRTVQRKAYEHRWRKEKFGYGWRSTVENITSPDGGEEEAIMPAIDIGMEMPEVEIPSVPTENQRPIPRRLNIEARDIERHGATVNCKGCVATLRGQVGVPHTDTCRKRLTDEIEKGQDGERAKRARQRELDFYEHVIKDSDQVVKRKAVAKDEEDLVKRRGHEEAGAPTVASSAGQNTPSSSSSGCIVDTGGDVTGVQRGKKRAAEDPPADCGDGDSMNKKGEMEQQEDVSMECLSFQENCDTRGLWMVACREHVEDAESSGALQQDSFEEQFGTTAQGNRWTPKKFERLVQRSSESWIDECGKKLTCRSALTIREEDQLAFDGLMSTRVSVCIDAGLLPKTSSQGARSTTKRVSSQPRLRLSWSRY